MQHYDSIFLCAIDQQQHQLKKMTTPVCNKQLAIDYPGLIGLIIL